MATQGQFLVATSACVLLVAFAGCTQQPDREAAEEPTAPAAAETEPQSDTSLTTAIQGELYGDRALRRQNIDVRVERGVATLSGVVDSLTVEQQALQVARNVEGVVRVDDQLTIADERRDQARADRTRTDEQSPAWITTKIQAQYFVDPSVKPWNIDVTTTSGGIVELRGEVDSAQAKTEAVRIARDTAGVTRVDDHLRIRGAGPEATAGARDQETARTRDDAMLTSDPWLTAKIRSKYFLDTDVKGRDIDVETNNGIVTLRGAVGSEAERRQAVALARNTDGVRQVRDELRIQPDTEARGTAGREAAAGVADVWITTKVQAQYFLDEDVKGHQIDVSTRSGVVTLTGSVRSEASRRLAEQIARETDGVSRVVNRLTVAPERGETAGR